MIIFVDIWIGILILNVILMIFKMINITSNKLVISIWFRLLSMQFLLIIFFAYYSSVLKPFVLDGGGIDGISTVVLIFAMYSVYFSFSFRFQFNGKNYIWFNGLYIRKISSDTINYINIFLKKDKTQKIQFVGYTKNYNFRYSSVYEFIIYNFARENNISIKKKNVN